jgi:DNA replication and repair protein RecF
VTGASDPDQSPMRALVLAPPIWIERLQLADFRNYASLRIDVSPVPIVIAGANGAGKTNLLEAVSLLAPGQGLRRAAYGNMARLGGPGTWSVTSTLRRGNERIVIGTGLSDASGARAQTSRTIRIDGEPAASSGLADVAEVLWLTPAMDGLFTAAASERRRFLDRLIASVEPAHRQRVALFERAMRQRNKLLDTARARDTEFTGLEWQMAEAGVAIAAGRRQIVAALMTTIRARAERQPASPFPWAVLAVTGTLEDQLHDKAAVEVEDSYRHALASGRDRDRAAGRTLTGPHLADLAVLHGPKQRPAALSSTGEQKALLINIILGQAELVAAERVRPLLLLDEIAAHLDASRRAALFDELRVTGMQAWLTGTDPSAFDALAGHAQFVSVAPD